MSSEDYYKVLGNNTDYAFDPEECMAENFGFAIAYGKDGKSYGSPEKKGHRTFTVYLVGDDSLRIFRTG